MDDPTLGALAGTLLSEALQQDLWLGAAPANVVLQSMAVVKLRGALRTVSIILAVMTGAALSLAAAAYVSDPGNLWELLLRMSMPPTLVLAVGLQLLGCVLRPRPGPRYIRTPNNAW